MRLQSRPLFRPRKWILPYTFGAFFLIICAVTTTHLHSSSVKQHERHSLHTALKPENQDLSFRFRAGPKDLLVTRDDAAWEARVAKGRLLKCLFAATTEAEAMAINGGNAVASIFTNYGDLWRWGYSDFTHDKPPSYGASLDQAFTDLGISVINNVEYTYFHDCLERDLKTERSIINNNEQIIEPSLGVFTNVINPTDGAIIADNNIGPRWQSTDLTVFPDLQQWSDVVFLEWQQYSGGNIMNLKWCFRAHVANVDTQNVVIEAYSKLSRTTIGDYDDRVSFNMDTIAGLAILGSPNGAGCGYLVAQHKAQLGIRRITGVVVWADTEWTIGGNLDNLLLHMYFVVEG